MLLCELEPMEYTVTMEEAIIGDNYLSDDFFDDEFDEADLNYTDADIIAITGEIPDHISDELNNHGIFDWEVVNTRQLDDDTMSVDDMLYQIDNYDFSMYTDYIVYKLTHKFRDFTEILIVYRFADDNVSVIINRELNGN